MKRAKQPSGNSNSIQKVPIRKVPTHIRGLDEVLEGGLPARGVTLVTGGPGSGKTVLGLEFLYRGASQGEPGLFLGFEEPAAALRRHAATLGWDLGRLERGRRLFLIEGRLNPSTVIGGQFSLAPLLSILSGKTRQLKARRLVMDAFDVLLRLMDDPVQTRIELHALSQWLEQCGLTTILTLKPRQNGASSLYEEFCQSMSDCVIRMDTRVEQQVATRRLRVIKYRGSSFGRNEYPYVITSKGISTIPVSTVGLRHPPFGERISSGVEGLDEMLAGGYHRASCVLLAGEPGTGKTLLAAVFTRRACQRGERVLYVSFEESEAALLHNLLSAGVDLSPWRRRGRLKFLSLMPEAMGAEEHLLKVMEAVEDFHPAHVVVDAISACPRMGGPQAAFEYLMRLLNYLKERGITTLLTNQTSGTRSHMEISGNGISSMIDTLVYVSYAHGQGETNRTIQVMKARGAAHSNQVREFVISTEGLQILEPYVGPGGVLTGTARRTQEFQEALDLQRRESEIHLKELEVARLQAVIQAELSRRRAELEAAQAELERLRGELCRAEAEREKRRQMRSGPRRNGLGAAAGSPSGKTRARK